MTPPIMVHSVVPVGALLLSQASQVKVSHARWLLPPLSLSGRNGHRDRGRDKGGGRRRSSRDSRSRSRDRSSGRRGGGAGGGGSSRSGRAGSGGKQTKAPPKADKKVRATLLGDGLVLGAAEGLVGLGCWKWFVACPG